VPIITGERVTTAQGGFNPSFQRHRAEYRLSASLLPDGKVLEISVPVAPAGSGGAVFDVFGRVVGIATTPHSYGANLSIAIPASAIAQMRSRERPAAK